MAVDPISIVALIISITAILITSIELYISHFRKSVELEHMGDFNYDKYHFGPKIKEGARFHLINLGNLPTSVYLYDAEVYNVDEPDNIILELSLSFHNPSSTDTGIIQPATFAPFIISWDDMIFNPNWNMWENYSKRFEEVEVLESEKMRIRVRGQYSFKKKMNEFNIELSSVDPQMLADAIDFIHEDIKVNLVSQALK